MIRRALAGPYLSKRFASHGLSHVDHEGQPAMVDVGSKTASARTAVAGVAVVLPSHVAVALRAQHASRREVYSAKGPVFQTAIIAGTQAVKSTASLIPFCHPLPIDGCKFSIGFADDSSASIEIQCQVSVFHKTGVEMEALTGAAVAALTVYDMVKALSHDVRIDGLRLLSKTGGKSDFGSGRDPARDAAVVPLNVPHSTPVPTPAEDFAIAQTGSGRGETVLSYEELISPKD
jgi:cyclic pyranopterin phosphate synthase